LKQERVRQLTKVTDGRALLSTAEENSLQIRHPKTANRYAASPHDMGSGLCSASGRSGLESDDFNSS
jgi:hypothetical protein